MQDKAVCFVSAFVFASSGLTASLPQNRSAGALREAPEVRLYPVSASRGGCAARTLVQARASRDEPSVPVEGGGGSAPRGVRAWTLRVPRQHGWGSFSQDGREGMALPGRGWNCGRGRPFRRFHTSPPPFRQWTRLQGLGAQSSRSTISHQGCVVEVSAAGCTAREVEDGDPDRVAVSGALCVYAVRARSSLRRNACPHRRSPSSHGA